jgi:Eco57I restriction-modification methylase
MSRRAQFDTIRSEGALLPTELLQRVSERDKELGGLRGEDYGLPPNEPLNEAIVRSYNRLVGAWASFQEARTGLPEGEPGTSVTRDRWLQVLMQELGYGRVQTAAAVEIGGKTYPVSHAWGSSPIHLVGCNIKLDRRARGVAGAATQSPHGTVQELLNRSDERLWGIVSNGLQLRLLRDNSSLTRQAYVEFDLEEMMEGEVYADFVLLWMVCHASRVEGDKPHESWLERWSQEAAKQGTRALEGLRVAVETAIAELGSGFLMPGRNAPLREALRNGELSAQEYYRELLRLVYRLLFLFVAEDRGLLHHPDAPEEARARYARWYSTRRLRDLAEKRRGTKHGDLWESLAFVMRALSDDNGCAALGLPALGSFLWSERALPHLERAQLPNRALLEAVRALATVREGKVLRGVDYKNLGAEELGSVYESLLELHPQLDVDVGIFALGMAAGNERKTTGSYYTPTSLISVLLDSALDPVVDEAAAKGEEAVLDLKVVDPACGSGHFLVAAAHRIAKRLASVRTGDEEPSPEATRHALRDVVSRCIYGVDVNPMAVELCKVSLWMEALDPGRPLSFLDAHVKCGNSLLGTTSELMAEGIPDDAFKALEGDDKEIAKALRKQNKQEREGQLSIEDAVVDLAGALEAEVTAAEALADESVESLRAKEQRFRELSESDAYERAKLAADAWCVAFTQRKEPGAPRITTGVVRRIATAGEVPHEVDTEVRRLAAEYGYFHWEIEFPQIFGPEVAGFDAVLGNPPWDQIEAELDADEGQAAEAARLLDGVQHFIHASQRFPTSSYGRLNLAPLFVEASLGILSPNGLSGVVVPTSVATDAFNQHLFGAIVKGQRLVSLYDFENRQALFPAVDSRQRFCLLTLSGERRRAGAGTYSFFGEHPADVVDGSRSFELSFSDFNLFNPNTKLSPAFRTRRDFELARALYSRWPVLLDRSGTSVHSEWEFRPVLMFMTNEPAFHGHVLGSPCTSGACLPVYEGKMVGSFDHRQADIVISPTASVRKAQGQSLTLQDHSDPERLAKSRLYIDEKKVEERLTATIGDTGWLVAFCDVTSATNERTVIAAAIPRVAAADTLPIVGVASNAPELKASFLAGLNTFAFDYLARQKIGGLHLRFGYVEQFVMPGPSLFRTRSPWDAATTVCDWLVERVVELTFTANDMRPMALDLGYDGPPFRWHPERRALLRAELDAAFFHLYGLDRDDVAYVMDTFPIIRRKDEQTHGEYQTKRVILEIYDELAQAIESGEPYRTRLDPPPADPSVAHSARLPPTPVEATP